MKGKMYNTLELSMLYETVNVNPVEIFVAQLMLGNSLIRTEVHSHVLN